MDAREKIAKQRLSVLQLAEALGNVTEACRRRGMARPSFYEYKKRFEKDGLDGLKDMSSKPHSQPKTTSKEVADRIEELVLLHPSYGCNRIQALLKSEGLSLNHMTIQKIMKRKGLGTQRRALVGFGKEVR